MPEVKYDYEKISALTKKPKEKSWPDQVGQVWKSQLGEKLAELPHQVLFSLDNLDAWGHETIMLRAQSSCSQQMSSSITYCTFNDELFAPAV